ncbi:MAG: hypothetical protein V8S27_01875 [Lachnospiraceae bacterium]
MLKRGNFIKYYYNTAVMTAGILISQVVTGIFAGYGFAKGKFKGQNLCFIIVLGALMIPLQVTFIPIYIMMANWGMSETFIGHPSGGSISVLHLHASSDLHVDRRQLSRGCTYGWTWKNRNDHKDPCSDV